MDEEKFKGDELDKFFVDENQPLDRQLLSELMRPYVESIGKNQVIEFKEDFEKLKDWQKILIFLVCRKAMLANEVIEDESVSPKEISEAIHISESSAKKISLNKVLKSFCKGSKGKYSILNYKLKKLKDLLKNE